MLLIFLDFRQSKILLLGLFEVLRAIRVSGKVWLELGKIPQNEPMNKTPLTLCFHQIRVAFPLICRRRSLQTSRSRTVPQEQDNYLLTMHTGGTLAELDGSD